MSPLGHWAYGHLSMVMPYPRFGAGLATRARRPRPSEKTTSRVISGLSPVGDRHCNWPRRGGAGSARPRGRRNANRIALSLRPPASRLLVHNIDVPRLASGPATRARRPRPSEKTVTSPTPLWQRNPFGTPTSWPSSPGNPTTN